MTNATSHAFTAEVSKVLKMMIHSVYTNRDIFLRELISNASDACDKLRYTALTQANLLQEDATLAIRVNADEAQKTITIADNGIGMSREEMIANLGTIAKSGTQEFMEALKDDSVNQIGQFGVGFYSAFMVAERVRVTSRKAGEALAHVWESDGNGEFTVTETSDAPRGTKVELFLQADAETYLDSYKLKHIIQTYSDHISFPVYLGNEQVSTGAALWTRAKNDITPEQYKEFYHHVAHQPDEPMLTLHSKVEGKLSYTCLLFVPSLKPFDLFHPDRKRRVKLYVKRVFITDEGVDLIPAYLRFLRGVVDSEDLPLNISRETLQANPMLPQIRDALAKKVLSELAKKAEGDEVSHLTFWTNYGAVVKEGLCESNAVHEQILDICRFASSTQNVPTSLAGYISRMKENQDTIFYLTGDNIDAMKSDPKLEGFTSRGLEVLLFNDHVDDFWVNVARAYKGKQFKSITRADIDLSAFGEGEDAPKEEAPKAETVIALFKTALGEKVSDVRTTNKLKDVPACLSVPEGAMDMRLERFLLEQKQIPAATAKILELNASHPLIQKIEHSEKRAELIELVFNQARILEGELPENPGDFIRAMNRMIVG
jgi:molecular chaperone HtpG